MEKEQKQEETVTRQVELNNHEAQALIDLMNIAVKAEGLQVAEISLVLSNKLRKTFEK
jgi:hypothetical protein